MKLNQPGYKLASLMFLILCATSTFAQQAVPAIKGTSEPVKSYAPATPVSSSETSERERILLDRIEKLERRLSELESRGPIKSAETAVVKTNDSSASASINPGEAKSVAAGVAPSTADTNSTAASVSQEPTTQPKSGTTPASSLKKPPTQTTLTRH